MRYLSGMAVNGIVMRSPIADDAPEIHALMAKIYGETEFLHTAADEFTISIAEEAAWLKHTEMSERDCIIGAWMNEAAVGTVHIRSCGSSKRVRHRAMLGICVAKDAWGKGVGSMLMDAAIQTAEAANYRQIELEVCADNERAIRLYRQFGFEEYGRRPNGMRRNGQNIEEILMVKLL